MFYIAKIKSVVHVVRMEYVPIYSWFGLFFFFSTIKYRRCIHCKMRQNTFKRHKTAQRICYSTQLFIRHFLLLCVLRFFFPFLFAVFITNFTICLLFVMFGVFFFFFFPVANSSLLSLQKIFGKDRLEKSTGNLSIAKTDVTQFLQYTQKLWTIFHHFRVT